jgi:hypothetical protein
MGASAGASAGAAASVILAVSLVALQPDDVDDDFSPTMTSTVVVRVRMESFKLATSLVCACTHE